MRTTILFALGGLHFLAVYATIPLGIAAIAWGFALRRQPAKLELEKDLVTPRQEAKYMFILGAILIVIGAFFAYRHFIG